MIVPEPNPFFTDELRGDIVISIDKKQLFVRREGEELCGRFGRSVWWIPLNDKYGLKVRHYRRYPRGHSGSLRSTTREEALKRLVEINERLNHLAADVPTLAEYIPEILATGVLCHWGRYQVNKRCDGVDEPAYYPVWLMRNCETKQAVTREEIDPILDDMEAGGFRFRPGYRQRTVTQRWSRAGIGRNEKGAPVFLDLVDEAKIKYI